MKWSLQQLYKFDGKSFDFQDTFNFEEDIKNIDDILGITMINVNGVCKVIYDEFRFFLNIRGDLILEDAVTLEAVNFPLDIEIEEVFTLDDKSLDARLITTNTIDLRDIIWENILLEKPIRFVKAETQE